MLGYLNQITPAQAALAAGACTATGVLVGSAVAAFFPFITAFLARRSQERWQVRHLAVQAGLDHCRHENQIKVELFKSGVNNNVVIETPDDYICHMLLMLDIATDTKISAQEAAVMIRRKSRKPQTGTPSASDA